jgi:hypothetical protein
MAALNDCKILKEKLSGMLLRPNSQFPNVHGVGIGRDNLNNYHVRIYVTGHNPRIFPVLADNIPLPMIPAAFPINTPVLTIREIICSRAVFAALPPAQDFRISEGCLRDSPFVVSPSSANALTKLIPGISIGLPNKSVGTIGFFCKSTNPTNSSTLILSNNHILANFNQAVFNDALIRPVKENGNVSPKTIAKLLSFEPLVFATSNNMSTYPRNYVDGALCSILPAYQSKVEAAFPGKLKTGETISYKISGTGTLENGRTKVPANQKVSKHGIGSCWSGGEIDDVDCDFVLVRSDGTKIFFVNQFRIVGKTAQNGVVTFATHGDSGSLVFEDKPTVPGVNYVNAVALVFAIGKEPTIFNAPNASLITKYTLATPISVVKDKLQIKLVGEL